MGNDLKKLATKEKLGGKSDRALTVTTINELQKYCRKAIPYILISMDVSVKRQKAVKRQKYMYI